jgi:glycosyltransferase involved in cell wall biosynthesis
LKISVIIPNYNCEKWLPLTIESCLIQKEYIKEIIVIDDSSTDNSWQILSSLQHEYPQLIRIYKNLQKGSNNARNYGFELSSGNFIQWLDADDQLVNGKLKTQLTFLQNNPKIDIVYSDFQINSYNANGVLQNKEHIKRKRYNDFIEVILNNTAWSPLHNYLLRKSAAQLLYKCQAWNEATVVGQDREYFTMGALSGLSFEYVPGNFVIYNRWSSNSISQKIKNNDKYISVLNILLRFFKTIEANVSMQQKREYFRIIRTEAHFIKTNSSAILPKPLLANKISDINFSLVKGYRTKLKMLLDLYRS